MSDQTVQIQSSAQFTHVWNVLQKGEFIGSDESITVLDVSQASRGRFLHGAHIAPLLHSPYTSNPASFLSLTIIRQHLVHLVPEVLGVIAVMNIPALVDDDVVDDGLRRHHAFPVKGQPARRRA